MSREDMDALLNDGLKFAIYLLEKNQEFYPFGVAMDVNGGIGHVNVYNSNEFPPSKDHRELLEKSLARGAAEGKYRAVAIVYDVKLTDTTTGKRQDAVALAMEHRDAEPVTCFLPYELKGEKIEGGEIVAQAGKRKIFKDASAG